MGVWGISHVCEHETFIGNKAKETSRHIIHEYIYGTETKGYGYQKYSMRERVH